MARALLLSWLLLASSASAAGEARRILFVGNSYLFVNNVPELVRAMAERDGQAAPHVDLLVAAGATLAQIVGEDSVPRVFADGAYDTVVLQERGGLLLCLSGAQRPRPPECSTAVSAHRKLAQLARRHGAERVIVYGTWSMSPGMQGPVSRGTRVVSSAIKATAVDVGAMLERAEAARPPLALFYPDRHLDAAGAVLAAAALYEAAYDRTVGPGAFRAEIPVWSGDAGFSPRRVVARQRRLPKPELKAIALTTAEMGLILAAVHR